MKKLSIIMISILFLGCAKKDEPVDPCLNVSCLNGGDCINGSCNCPPGYSGLHCEIYDPCYGIVCFNGGTCINGLCDCPPGYTGPDCATVKTPVSMTITKVSVTEYPATAPSGGGWDINSGPDIFLTINMGTTWNTNDYVSSYYTNASGPIYTTAGFPKTLSASSNWTIAIWDYDDLDANDVMGGYYFKPVDFDSGFPNTITLSNTSVGITFILDVSWNF